MTETPPTPARAEMSREEAEIVLRILAGLQGASVAESAPGPRPKSAEPPAPLPAPVPVQALPPGILQALVESVSDALLVTDEAGRIVLVNAQTERLFGYARGELLGQAVEILVPERFRAKHVGDRADYAAKPTVKPMGPQRELVGRRKDGHEIPIEVGLSPLATEIGPLVVASIRDVTERRKSVAELKKLEQRYRTLVEGIPAVTFLAAMDETTNELYVSPYIEKLLGFTQKEWLENPILWYAQLHPDDRQRWHDEFAKTVATGATFQSVYRFIAKPDPARPNEQRVVWVHGEAHLARDEAGRPLFLQGVAFDITPMKQAEEELKALIATLDQRVKERTAELEARSEELARSNRDLSLFAGAVSHDLTKHVNNQRKPLKELAEQYWDWTDPLAREADLALNTALARVDDMEKMIDSLLKFSEARTKEKELVPVSCAEAAARVYDLFRGDFRALNGDVGWDELPVVLADKELLELLFQNLIGNSLKFRVDGRPPLVSITASREGAKWRIEVTDNGIGFEEHKRTYTTDVKPIREQIFDLGGHSRQHKSEKKYGNKYPGFGIGLSTCKNIVERYGGSIEARSEGLGKGTTISFTLPAAE